MVGVGVEAFFRADYEVVDYPDFHYVSGFFEAFGQSVVLWGWIEVA